MFVFTSCTNNYIPKARVLASSLKSFHPDWTFCLLLGERPPKGFDLADEPFDRLMTFDRLPIPNYPSWLFRHRVVEICTAAKGPALQYFLENERREKVLYLDPDIMVCNSLAPLEKLLDSHDVLLTPHQLAPQETEQSIVDNELCAMRYGVFNLGFVAAARRGDGLRFASWWRDRLLEYCRDDIPNGLFTDQRWCDLAPAFFPNLHIVRDAGCNAASWNLTDRTVTRDENGVFWANDGPLRFYHFTGFDSGAGDGMTARYAGNMPAVHELWALYRERLAACGHAELGKTPWAHTNFDDGTPITDDMRRIYRERKDVRHAFPDPFKRPGFYEWYLVECAHPAKTLLFRTRRKTTAVFRRIRLILEQHGGFPQGVPGAIRYVADKVRDFGPSGAVRNILGSNPNMGSPSGVLPVLGFILADRNSPLYKRLFAMAAPENRPVCVIEHDLGGGAAAYCRERVESLLAEGRCVLRMRYDRALSRLEMAVCFSAETLPFEVRDMRDLGHDAFPRIADVIVNEFVGWRHDDPDYVALLQEDIRSLAWLVRRHGAKLEFLFHDFFALCPRVSMINRDGVYCDVNSSVAACDACAELSISAWRETWKTLLDIADTVVFFSESSREIVSRVYGLREEQVVVRPHAVRPLGPPVAIAQTGPMRVAVAGTIVRHKGAEIIRDLAMLMEKEMPDASIVVFGTLDIPDIPENITVLGEYARDDLPRLVAGQKVTVGFFPSVLPETFSYVVRELASLGLPVVSFDLGAQGEYVKSLPSGVIAPAVTAEAAFAALKKCDAYRKITVSR